MLMQQFLRKNAPRVEPGDVNKHIAELEATQKKQGKTLADFLKETGQSEVQLRINILNMLQWNSYVKGHLTDDDIKKYYDEGREFFDRVEVRASHIVIRVPATASEAEKLAARTKLQAIRQQILSGTLDFADAAMKRVGLRPKRTVVRGGTDGSRLTELGLPTPNLSCGEYNLHSPLEWTCVEEMETAVRVLV